MNVIDLSKNRIHDGFFVLNGCRTSPCAWPSDSGDAYHFVGTYRDSGAPIREALIEMIRGAKRRVFVTSFIIGDEAIVSELQCAAERLRGGVYVITALDEKSLRKGLTDCEGQEQGTPEEQKKYFQRLTSSGVYVRGHESCHAKFAVVDNTIALAGSANFVANGFEWTGEANLVIRDPLQVTQLARLFTALWYEGCSWELPPGETYLVAKRQPVRPPIAPSCPDFNGSGVVWTNEANETYLHKCICDVIARARNQITLASYSVTGMNDKPHLLLQPLQKALARGVSIRLFVRQQNPNASQRADLCTLFDMGVAICGDLRNHAKGIVADETFGALFSSNFDAAHGLDSGVEVGVRLDGHPALKDFEHYLNHAMINADARFVRSPTLEQLDGKLAARWCQPWPWEREIEVACPANVAQRFLAETQEGPVLYEMVGTDLRLFAGRSVLSLQRREGCTLMAHAPEQSGKCVTEQLDEWLSSVRGSHRGKVIPVRGFCPATIRCLLNDASE